MVEKFRIGLALQPVATALFANSPLRDGAPTDYLSWRSHVWTDVDPDRWVGRRGGWAGGLVSWGGWVGGWVGSGHGAGKALELAVRAGTPPPPPPHTHAHKHSRTQNHARSQVRHAALGVRGGHGIRAVR